MEIRPALPPENDPFWQEKRQLIRDILRGYSSGDPRESAIARYQYDELREKHPEVFITEAGADYSWDDLVKQLEDGPSLFD